MYRRLTFYTFSLLTSIFMVILPLSIAPSMQTMEELCDNAIDDDMDGLVDLNDPDCDCVIIEPISLIPNPSFEDLVCCPLMDAELDCAENWIQASFPTTDFIHLCGWLGWDNEENGGNYPPPQPFPDGSGIVGFRDGIVPNPNGPNPNDDPVPNWKEYAGACLLSPMFKDSSYRIEFDLGFVNSDFSPPITVTLYGTNDCNFLPFGGMNFDNLIGCPTNAPGWVKLGSVYVNGGKGNQWLKRAIEVQPNEDIMAIAIGPSCRPNPSEFNLYYFLDNLLLDNTRSFDLKIKPYSQPCKADFSLSVESEPNVSYQWYKDGIALLGEVSSQLSKMYGVGVYQVRVSDETECSISGEFQFSIPVLRENIDHIICEGDKFIFGEQGLETTGTYTDTLVSSTLCDSIVTLTLVVEGATIDTITAMMFEGKVFKFGNQNFSQAGEYLIESTSEDGCKVIVLLQLEYFDIYYPNIFSPNQDGVNDIFTIVAEDGLIQDVDLSIFDRWGNLISKGKEWNGKSNNQFVAQGVYIFVAKLTMIDNSYHTLSGSITVIN